MTEDTRFIRYKIMVDSRNAADTLASAESAIANVNRMHAALTDTDREDLWKAMTACNEVAFRLNRIVGDLERELGGSRGG